MKKLTTSQLTQHGGFCSSESLRQTAMYLAAASVGGLIVHVYHQSQKKKNKGLVNTMIDEATDAYDFLSEKALPATQRKFQEAKEFIFGSEQ